MALCRCSLSSLSSWVGQVRIKNKMGSPLCSQASAVSWEYCLPTLTAPGLPKAQVAMLCERMGVLKTSQIRLLFCPYALVLALD